MRFMAIIALSLVAIMSLVNEAAPDARPVEEAVNVIDPAPSEDEPPVPPLEPLPDPTAPRGELPNELPEILVPAPAPEPIEPPPPAPPPVEPVEPTPIKAPPTREVVVIRRERPIEPPPVAEPEPIPAPAPPRVTPVPKAPPQPRPAPVEPASEAEAAPEAADAPKKDEGLQLRFHSERAFLGLVARGEIDVYAYRPGVVLHLDQQFALKPTRAPGEVYNLAVGTVPDAIRRGALDPAFTWAVALPAHTRREIQRHIDRRASGVIEIQATGAVRHVPSR